MAVMKEYICLGHGIFESTEPFCPSGCNTVNRIFLTAPGIRSQRTGNIDRTLVEVAKDLGLTDMSNRNGSVANSRPVPMADMSQLKAGFAPLSGDIAQSLAAINLHNTLPGDGVLNHNLKSILRMPTPDGASLIHPEDMK